MGRQGGYQTCVETRKRLLSGIRGLLKKARVMPTSSCRSAQLSTKSSRGDNEATERWRLRGTDRRVI